MFQRIHHGMGLCNTSIRGILEGMFFNCIYNTVDAKKITQCHGGARNDAVQSLMEPASSAPRKMQGGKWCQV